MITDQLQVEEENWKALCNVLALAEKFLLENLKIRCETLLKRHIKYDTALELLQFADLHRAETLKEEALRYVSVHFHQLRQEDVLKKTPASLLADIMMRL